MHTCLVTPFNLAFDDPDNPSNLKKYMEWISDVTFGIDIVVNFFSAYFDKEDNLVF